MKSGYSLHQDVCVELKPNTEIRDNCFQIFEKIFASSQLIKITTNLQTHQHGLLML